MTATTWPDDLHVIQLGDLLGGLDDVACCDLAAEHIDQGRWTQLPRKLGTGSARTRRDGPLQRPERSSARTPKRSPRSATGEQGNLPVATTLRSAKGATALITHAGLSSGMWTEIGNTIDANIAARRLNKLPIDTIGEEGAMTTGKPNFGAGPLWVSTAELWTSWLDLRVPFPLIHGHTTAWLSRKQQWSPYVTSNLTQYATPTKNGHVNWTSPKGGTIIGIDCSIGRLAPRDALRPLVFHDAHADTWRS